MTSPGQARTDTMAAPAGKPVSVSCHSRAPVLDEYAVHGQPGADRGDAAADGGVGQAGGRHRAGQPGGHVPRAGQRGRPPDHAGHGPGGRQPARQAAAGGTPGRALDRVRHQGHAEQGRGQHPAPQPRRFTRRAEADPAEDAARGPAAHPAEEAGRGAGRAAPRRGRPEIARPRCCLTTTTVGELRRLNAADHPKRDQAGAGPADRPPALPITWDQSIRGNPAASPRRSTP